MNATSDQKEVHSNILQQQEISPTTQEVTPNKNEGMPVQHESPHITHTNIATPLGEASEA